MKKILKVTLIFQSKDVNDSRDTTCLTNHHEESKKLQKILISIYPCIDGPQNLHMVPITIATYCHIKPNIKEDC